MNASQTTDHARAPVKLTGVGLRAARVLITLGRIGDKRKSAVLDAGAAALLMLAVNTASIDLVERAAAGDDAARDDLREMSRLAGRLG